MSRRALAALMAVAILGGLLNAVFLYPRFGNWSYASLVILGIVNGSVMASWDRKSGKHGWFS